MESVEERERGTAGGVGRRDVCKTGARARVRDLSVCARALRSALTSFAAWGESEAWAEG